MTIIRLPPGAINVTLLDHAGHHAEPWRPLGTTTDDPLRTMDAAETGSSAPAVAPVLSGQQCAACGAHLLADSLSDDFCDAACQRAWHAAQHTDGYQPTGEAAYTSLDDQADPALTEPAERRGTQHVPDGQQPLEDLATLLVDAAARALGPSASVSLWRGSAGSLRWSVRCERDGCTGPDVAESATIAAGYLHIEQANTIITDLVTAGRQHRLEHHRATTSDGHRLSLLPGPLFDGDPVCDAERRLTEHWLCVWAMAHDGSVHLRLACRVCTNPQHVGITAAEFSGGTRAHLASETYRLACERHDPTHPEPTLRIDSDTAPATATARQLQEFVDNHARSDYQPDLATARRDEQIRDLISGGPPEARAQSGAVARAVDHEWESRILALAWQRHTHQGDAYRQVHVQRGRRVGGHRLTLMLVDDAAGAVGPAFNALTAAVTAMGREVSAAEARDLEVLDQARRAALTPRDSVTDARAAFGWDPDDVDALRSRLEARGLELYQPTDRRLRAADTASRHPAGRHLDRRRHARLP